MNIEQMQVKSEFGDHSWLYRQALENGYVNEQVPFSETGIYCVNDFKDKETHFRARLNESLLTALEYPNPIIRVRAVVHAYYYMGLIEGMGVSLDKRTKETLMEARTRIEDLVFILQP